MKQVSKKTTSQRKADARVTIKLDESKLLGCTLKGRSMAGDIKPLGLVKPDIQRPAV